jgi:hypothetical protein
MAGAENLESPNGHDKNRGVNRRIAAYRRRKSIPNFLPCAPNSAIPKKLSRRAPLVSSFSAPACPRVDARQPASRRRIPLRRARPLNKKKKTIVRWGRNFPQRRLARRVLCLPGRFAAKKKHRTNQGSMCPPREKQQTRTGCQLDCIRKRSRMLN